MSWGWPIRGMLWNRREREKRAVLLLPRTHCLKSFGLGLGPCLNLPARDTCGGPGMLESQTWGEWRLLLYPASLMRAPHRQKHQISPVPPCGRHLCGSSTPGALRRHLIKGQAAGKSRGIQSGSFRPPVHLFTTLFLSRFLEGFSHNVSNFMVEFPEMIEK